LANARCVSGPLTDRCQDLQVPLEMAIGHRVSPSRGRWPTTRPRKAKVSLKVLAGRAHHHRRRALCSRQSSLTTSPDLALDSRNHRFPDGGQGAVEVSKTSVPSAGGS
jgi:hypothetical protein